MWKNSYRINCFSFIYHCVLVFPRRLIWHFSMLIKPVFSEIHHFQSVTPLPPSFSPSLLPSVPSFPFVLFSHSWWPSSPNSASGSAFSSSYSLAFRRKSRQVSLWVACSTCVSWSSWLLLSDIFLFLAGMGFNSPRVLCLSYA